MFKNTTKKFVQDAAEEFREEIKKDLENINPFIQKAVVYTMITLIVLEVVKRKRPTTVVNQFYMLRETPDINYIMGRIK